MNTKLIKLALAIGAMAMVGTAMADSETSTLTVDANVLNACAIGDATLDFGDLALAVQADGTLGGSDIHATSGDIALICTLGATATIGGDGGQNHGATRFMKNGSNTLGYEIYTDSYTTVLDDSSNKIPYTGTGANDIITIKGSITQAQLALAPGTAGGGGLAYQDHVTLTIHYSP